MPKRHKFLYYFFRNLTGPFVKLYMGYRCTGEKRAYTPAIIIANHNTDLDPVLVALGVPGPMYFVASEHVLRKGFWAKVLTLFFAPIPINKTQTDSTAVKEILRRIRAGSSVCVFAEGNRSYTGVTGPIPASTAKLIKISKASLITYRIEGGYFTTPRWANQKRRGKMTGGVAGVYSQAELAAMDEKQILGLVERDIHENAYERQKENPVRFRGKNLAEHIETVLYLCPECKSIGTIHSSGDEFTCGCGMAGRFTDTGFLEGESLRFSTVPDWAAWQTGELAVIVQNAGDGPICTDDDQELFLVQTASKRDFIGKGPMQISRTELRCANYAFPLEQITRFAIVDKMTLLFSLMGGAEYEIRSAAPRSVLKYLEAFNILLDIQ